MVRALASHQCGRGSYPGVDAICGLSLLLVLSLAPRGFFPGTPVFPLDLLKNQHFQIPIRPGIRWTKNHYVDVLPANRYLFIYFIYLQDVFPKSEDILQEKSKCSMDSTSVWQKAHLSDSTWSKRKSFNTV